MLKEVKQKPIFDKILKHETKWIQLGYKCKEVNFMNVTVCILCIVIQLLQFKPSNAQNFIKVTIIPCVPLATEPSISLIILPLIRILQRNFQLSCVNSHIH